MGDAGADPNLGDPSPLKDVDEEMKNLIRKQLNHGHPHIKAHLRLNTIAKIKLDYQWSLTN